ncbi:MAG: hypothetical protein ACLFPX_04640 [Candidatus Omnitrophota bacterium]
MPKAFPKPVATMFFLIGLISAISFRIIIIVQHFHPAWVRIFWYLAVITNIIFFLFRYHIALKRKRAVNSTVISQKLQTGQPLAPQDRDALLYLLTSINRSRENLNYLSLFILSLIAIVIDILLSL